MLVSYIMLVTLDNFRECIYYIQGEQAVVCSWNFKDLKTIGSRMTKITWKMLNLIRMDTEHKYVFNKKPLSISPHLGLL